MRNIVIFETEYFDGKLVDQLILIYNGGQYHYTFGNMDTYDNWNKLTEYYYILNECLSLTDLLFHNMVNMKHYYDTLYSLTNNKIYSIIIEQLKLYIRKYNQYQHINSLYPNIKPIPFVNIYKDDVLLVLGKEYRKKYMQFYIDYVLKYSKLNIFMDSKNNNKIIPHAVIYKIVHLPTGIYYIGQHQSNNMEGYSGSGKLFTKIVNQSNHKDFSKHILLHLNDISKYELDYILKKYIELNKGDLLCLNIAYNLK